MSYITMDGAQKESRERSYPRVPSRSSTASTVNTQMTPKSANSSSSHLRDPTRTNSHSTHRHHHSHSHHNSSSGNTRPMSRLSREPSDELRKSATTTAVSSLLQERIQQERIERHVNRMSNDLSASTGDIREKETQNSPIRRAATAMGRQKPDAGNDSAKETGMGVRQMEQTVSTLHKQNFDLKLELYHRREKQTILEERVEKLENQQQEMMDLHESFINELESKDKTLAVLVNEMEDKDKALAEAVTLIVGLETRIDELERERYMVSQVEADESYRRSAPNELEPEPESSASSATPKPTNLSIPFLSGDSKPLARMPSFLSDHSQQTETLRNVVLRGRSSVMQLRRISNSSVDPSEINRIASPSLSVLSESSFVSIYGNKDAGDKASPPPTHDVAGLDGSHVDRISASRRIANIDSRGGGTKLSSAQMQSLNNVLDAESPLQKVERLDRQPMNVDHISTQAMSYGSRSTATPTYPVSSTNLPQQGKSKHEKREALQKVLTNYPMQRDFSNPHAFPPTPDTVSSSTLRNHQTFTSSQDSLTKHAGTVPSEGLARASDRMRVYTRESAYHQFSNQQPPRTVLSGNKYAPMPNINTELISDLGQFARTLPPRPHSAAETLSSRARANSIGSDSDSDGGADARSETDSFDYWMRESMKPNKYQANSTEQRGNGRPVSPDLFSFPADARGWETDVIFGALKGSGYLGSPVSALKRDPLDEMASSLQPQQAEVYDPPMSGAAPPTPDRRSSLHAHTGSTSATATSGSKLRRNLAKGPGMGWVDGRGRSNSVDTAAQAPSTRVQPQQAEGATSGRRHQYPPITGQASKGRGLGLNSFFKKSGSENFNVPASATESTFPVPQLSGPPPTRSSVRPSGRNSVPPPTTMPWRPPAVVEDDLQSATPPPIMRSRGQSLVVKTGGIEIAEPATPLAETTAPNTPTTVLHAQSGSTKATPNEPQSGGGRRKWLGLGRMGSSRNKTG
ncbi:hypothetical protein M426DRAFT_152378 [Hypoxylon sp. CI-4A]|nr:hypothetical protein M426DRAFT_152378 [Hypoxylon sp. CI-4A]